MRTGDIDFHDRLLTKLRQEPGFSGSKLEARINQDKDALQSGSDSSSARTCNVKFGPVASAFGWPSMKAQSFEVAG